MIDPALVTRYLNGSAEAMKEDWKALVRLAVSLDQDPKGIQEAATLLAFNARTGTESVKRKILAIQYSAGQGNAMEEIVAFGQEATIAAFNKSRRDEQLEQQVWLKWKVSGVIRELAQAEIDRVCNVLTLTTSEMFWQWMIAQLRNTTDPELRHAAGEAPPRATIPEA